MGAGRRRAARTRGRRRRRDAGRGPRHRRGARRGGCDGRTAPAGRPSARPGSRAPSTTGPRRSRRRPRSSPSSAAPASPVAVDHLDPDAGAAVSPRGSPATTATSTCSSTTSGAASCSRAARRSGTRRSGSTTSTKGLRILRLAVDTHLITSHHLLPLLVDRPGGLVVEVTDGTTDYNATQYRISVFYDLAKVAVNRLAFSQGHELAPYGATAVPITPGCLRSEMMLDAFGVTEETWRDALDRRPATSGPRRRPTSRCRSRRATSGRAVAALAVRSRPGALEPAVGRLRPARARVRLHRRRRLAARRLAFHRRGPRTGERRGPRRLPLRRDRCLIFSGTRAPDRRRPPGRRAPARRSG